MDKIREHHPRQLFIQAIIIIIIGTCVGFAVNAVSPESIATVGTWKVVIDSTGITKPEYFEDQDTLITVEQAMILYQADRTVFIDARLPEEYEECHIKGALLLPFEEYDDYIDSIRKEVPRDAKVVAYCGEEDCDLSLYLARVLREEEGYKEVYTLYGGIEAWEKHGLPMTSHTENNHEWGD